MNERIARIRNLLQPIKDVVQICQVIATETEYDAVNDAEEALAEILLELQKMENDHG